VVRALMVAMLAGQHSLPCGAHLSLPRVQLALGVAGRADGARYWEILLGKLIDPKRMFGSIGVAALMHREARYGWTCGICPLMHPRASRSQGKLDSCPCHRCNSPSLLLSMLADSQDGQQPEKPDLPLRRGMMP
jgi:hypothetical protein